ncbi:MAG: hypothetical protein JSW52_11215 [Candidatus Coatesbacteria bacterium]|nr:MAG: hypothetical protein JSW52_11215 [Candidatus Coatesbacteria bacterium]
MRKLLVIIIIITYLAFTVISAYGTEIDAAVEIPTMVEANLALFDDSGTLYPLICQLYEDDDKESEYSPGEVFYFGPDEGRIRAEIEKKMKYRDPAAKAHHDIRLIIGSSFIVTAGVMAVLGLLHTRRELPRDYYKNKKKYDEIYEKYGYVPLTEIKEVYYPSIVIGAVMGGTGIYLFF